MRYLPLLLVALMLPLAAQAQRKVSSDDLEGEWKMIIHLEQEVEEADNLFERLALKAVAGIMEEVDIRLEFDSDGQYVVSTSVFDFDHDDDDDDGDREDQDDGNWWLTKHGGLILGDSVHINSNEETVFYFVDGDLVGFEMNRDGKPGDRQQVSLQRMRR